MSGSARRLMRTGFLWLSGALFFLFLFGPIYWMVATSFMTEAEMLAKPLHLFPHAPTLASYRAVLGLAGPAETEAARTRAVAIVEVWPGLRNSMVVALSVAVANLLIATPAAYAFARLRSRFSLPLLLFYLASRMVPGIMLVVPMFLIIRWLGLIDSPLAIILADLVFTIPFSIWLLQSYFKTLPAELEDAALVDGCTRFTAAIRILLPLAVPGLTSVAILAFMSSWNEFLFALIFSKTTASKTLPVVVASFVDQSSVQFDYVMTAGVVAVIPPFLLVLLFQRYIVSGFSAGAVKG